eukprot:CAMPEP_0179106424 /NCGR_PEP_ID=MMETSP0796-20121207/49484_1 /TAXON_ID=73915 /ORGANISM="Pyrodinium bahamense, Strain pbaha01" /LENGTH=89 /DNA_ID=CAMNT_0020804457 /DNA_START=64 /DNA_END=330 /DNA_ORIENTATION=+
MQTGIRNGKSHHSAAHTAYESHFRLGVPKVGETGQDDGSLADVVSGFDSDNTEVDSRTESTPPSTGKSKGKALDDEACGYLAERLEEMW